MLDSEALKNTRFHLDDPAQFGFSLIEDASENSWAHARFLKRYVEITSALFPELSDTINTATKWLLGSRYVHAFISADESMNAACTRGPDNLPIIWVSSGLIKSLNNQELSFVIGHELGHWYYEHHLYPEVAPDESPRFVARQQLSRAAEISSDRFGLLACRDVDVALRAILKTASGLTDNFIGPRVSEFAGQLRSLEIGKIDLGEVFATHPPMAVRARALMWYSMSEEYSNLSGDGPGGLSLRDVDLKVESDLTAVLGKGFKSRQEDEIQDAILWMTLYELIEDGVLCKEDQAIIRNDFGDSVLKKVRQFVRNKSSQQVRNEIRQKAENARMLISAYPRSLLNAYIGRVKIAGSHASRFLNRFS